MPVGRPGAVHPRFIDRLKPFFVTLKGPTRPGGMKNVMKPSQLSNSILQNLQSLLALKSEKHFSCTWQFQMSQ